MRQHAADFRAAGIPYVFDPGQGLPLFSGEELIEMIDGAAVVAVNDYEAQLLSERTGLSTEAIAKRVDALVVTLGAEGSRIHVGGSVIRVPAIPPAALVDPTGCGDAYRAGLLYGMAQRWDWEKTGRLAALLGSLKIAARGGQNHAVNRDAIASLYSERFGSHPW
jgi:adenosine kinase